MKENLINFLNNYFDAIFVIFYVGNTDRLPILQKELDRVGISSHKNFQYYYDVSSPYDIVMYKDIKIYYPTHEENKLGVKKLAMNHYKIMKISQAMNYNKILIMEDDVCFLKDLEFLLKLFESSPANADLILYDKMIWKIQLNNYNKIFKNNAYLNFTNHSFSNLPFSSAACYMLSTNGINELIQNYENKLTAADTYINFCPGTSINRINRYVANINLCIQNAPGYFENHYLPFVNLSLYNLPNENYKNIIH